MSISDKVEKLLLRAEIGKALTREEIADLLRMPPAWAFELFAAADRVRKNEVGDAVFLRGIVEFSNYCTRDCLYCGLRKSNHAITRYRMSNDEILHRAEYIRKTGISTVVLQSGEDPFYSSDKVCRLIEKIRKETKLVVTLSIGERPLEDFKAFYQAGAERYLLKHETASRALYEYLRPGCLLKSRVSCLQFIKQLGFETGTGNMVGLPGQTFETLADDLLLMKSLNADMLGIGPFIPHPNTPLAGMENDGIDLTIRVLAMARLLTRNTNIPATTALATLHPQGRIFALQAGANVVMPDFTPEPYRYYYNIYPGKEKIQSPEIMVREMTEELYKIGRYIDFSAGTNLNLDHRKILH
ncbi:MAG TPA: [FeFe] hydrogenase H-cluster radical SAM maturase HydE [Smithella sp.]|nr:[FeFe] hydrogenase H-cluster radical SAM maturase HydE [Smithella sp.]